MITSRRRARPCRFRHLSLAGAAALILLVPSAGRAEPPQLSDEARADQLFRSGEKKFDSGEYGGACADFSESLKLGPKLGTLLNVALCHETVGKPVTAWHEFTHAAAWAAQNNQRDRYEFAAAHIRGLEPKLPRVILQLPGDRAIASIDLDGEPLPEQRWYLPLYLDPGEHRLAVTAPGKERTAVSFRVTSSPGDQLVYVPELADEHPSEPSPEPAKPEVDDTRRMLGLVGVGAGALATIVGATFGVLAITADERDPVVHGRATAATIAFGAGAALGAAGGLLLWTSSRSTVKATLGAAPRRAGASLSLSASF